MLIYLITNSSMSTNTETYIMYTENTINTGERFFNKIYFS